MHRTTTGIIPSSTTGSENVSHIPTSNKSIKSKQSKDDGLKRASVRRTTRSKLSRSPSKPKTLTVTSIALTNTTITSTMVNSQSYLLHNGIHEEELIGPVTRRMCRFCKPLDDNTVEIAHKRGKRSLSNSTFNDKKNKLSRKNLALVPSSKLTTNLKKNSSLDSALALQETDQSLSEHQLVKASAREKQPSKMLTTVQLD